MKTAALILLLFSLFSHQAEAAWQGEWGAWTKQAKGYKGSGLKLHACDEKTCSFLFTSEDGAGHECTGSGQLLIETENGAKGRFDVPAKVKSCSLAVIQAPNQNLRVTLEGKDCLHVCTSEKAKQLPASLRLLSETPYFDALPWPECQVDERTQTKALCSDQKLSQNYSDIQKVELKTKELQQTFYLAKEQLPPRGEDPLKTCEGQEDIKACLEAAVPQQLKGAESTQSNLRALKNKHEADLKTTGALAKPEVDALKGTYTRKFKTGTASGDKFEVTDDAKIGIDEDGLAFDVLLNFFDEKECTLSGTAKPLKSGRFLLKEKDCRLLIFKEGSDLVFADDPPQSCRSHCGKGGSFFGARFPLSSRK